MEIWMPSLGTAEDRGLALPGGGSGHHRWAIQASLERYIQNLKQAPTARSGEGGGSGVPSGIPIVWELGSGGGVHERGNLG